MVRRYCETFEKIVCERYEEGDSVSKIAGDFHKGTTAISRVLKRNGIKMRLCAGKDHPSWKGGVVEKGAGYVGIWKPDHDRADNRGYVFEHTLVMEAKIGRLPVEGEVIHHVNLDKKDNHPDNLYLCNHREHLKMHRDLEKVAIKFMEKGLLKFDHDTGEYVIIDK